jgi:nucleoside-diphosphate-sugar epimerase
MPSALIVGASGIVGAAALEHFLSKSVWTNITAISRRKPEIDEVRPYTHIAVDLRDQEQARSALSQLKGITHVIYAALYEKPGLVAGWREPDQMDTNLAMLRNCLEPLLHFQSLRHVSILQGGKAYGVHLHPMPVPAYEFAPRDKHDNFYWLQEDYLKEMALKHGFSWTVLRARIMIGRSWGVAMNLIPVLGAYAAICKEQGERFSFPGGPSSVRQATDARLLAEVIEWAALSPQAADEHFNVDNGDVFEWRDLWPSVADALGVAVGPDQPRSMAEYFADKEDCWARICRKYCLRDISLPALLGESHHVADFMFSHGMNQPAAPAFTSRIKLQQASFIGCRDTRNSFVYFLRDLMARRVIPGPHAYAAAGTGGV